MQSALVTPTSGRESETPREIIRAALVRAREDASSEQALAYQALELAYLKRSVSHERAAEQIAVSRTTFYCLLKRGVQGLARTLPLG